MNPKKYEPRKTFRHSIIKLVLPIALLAGLGAALFYAPAQTKPPGKQLYFVKRVVDGDTILLANNERVRYIGVDTPESVHPYKAVEYMAKEASSFNKKLVSGKWVRLEFDVERRDKYGRLLAYVYEGDVFVNAELVKQGYAQVYTFPPNVKYQELFLEYQRQARKNNRGLWKQ